VLFSKACISGIIATFAGAQSALLCSTERAPGLSRLARTQTRGPRLSRLMAPGRAGPGLSRLARTQTRGPRLSRPSSYGSRPDTAALTPRHCGSHAQTLRLSRRAPGRAGPASLAQPSGTRQSWPRPLSPRPDPNTWFAALSPLTAPGGAGPSLTRLARTPPRGSAALSSLPAELSARVALRPLRLSRPLWLSPRHRHTICGAGSP
jgi:hypothetical protein